MPNYKTISVNEFAELHKQKNVDLVDVRTPAEFQEVRAVEARNIPLSSFDPEEVMKQRNGSAEEPLYVICNSGNRSSKACEKLVKAGFENIVNVEGGTAAWDQAGHPVVRGKKVISLERQVRIAAGFLVLLGVGLSFIHPYFLGISAFVGAGLMFAGITDTCGMAMMLARMPWNQVKCEGETCST